MYFMLSSKHKKYIFIYFCHFLLIFYQYSFDLFVASLFSFTTNWGINRSLHLCGTSIAPLGSEICENLCSQTSHLNDFFPSWTDATCRFKSLLFEKLFWQTIHLKGLYPPWTEATGWLKSSLIEKLCSQTLHLNDFFSSFDSTDPFENNCSHKLLHVDSS